MTVLILALMTATFGAQPPAPSAATPASAPPPAIDAAPVPPSDFSYERDGRRDPFVSLINHGVETRGTAKNVTRPDGVAGMLVDELVVRGIVQSRGVWTAMVGAPNGRTYSLRQGDRLLDGDVRTIDAQAVVLTQVVKDPLARETKREVRKYLRGEVQ